MYDNSTFHLKLADSPITRSHHHILRPMFALRASLRTAVRPSIVSNVASRSFAVNLTKIVATIGPVSEDGVTLPKVVALAAGCCFCFCVCYLLLL